MDVVVHFDDGMPSNAVCVTTYGDQIRIRLSNEIDITPVAAMHPEVQCAITKAVAERAAAPPPVRATADSALLSGVEQ